MYSGADIQSRGSGDSMGAHGVYEDMVEDLDTGTALDDLGDDLFGTEEGDPLLTTDTAPDTGDGATTDDDQRLIDPATLPDQLKPHWGRMTQVNNQRVAAVRERERGLTELERKAGIVDRLGSDPTYARQVVEQMATQLGMSLTAGASPAQPSDAGAVPANVLQAAQQALADQPDVQFLAPVIAKVAYNIAQETVQPFQKQQEQQQQQQRRHEYEQMSSTLSETAPGWEEHEDAMEARFQFLKDALNQKGPMVHPRFGSVLEMLYRLETGHATATAEAGRRMQRALTNRTTTGTGRRTPAPNIQEQIAKAGTPDDQWAIAFNAAVAEERQ